MNFDAAIPHTDAECVREEFVAVITMQEPVTFYSMEDNTQQVKAQIIFVLGLNSFSVVANNNSDKTVSFCKSLINDCSISNCAWGWFNPKTKMIWALPVTFYSMEDNTQQVKAQIIFVLGLNQPHAQLEMLQSLMRLFFCSVLFAKGRTSFLFYSWFFFMVVTNSFSVVANNNSRTEQKIKKH
jgi:hypothetical protein